MRARIFSMVALTFAASAFAQSRLTVPAGTVIPLRMESYLSSASSRVGDRFTATVFRNVEVDGVVAIPEGSKVEGRVTQVTPAERKSKAGTIGIAFERLMLPSGRSIEVDGTLTTLDQEARRKLEGADEEDTIEGGSQKRRAIVFIGGGAGAGAVIGVIAGGGKGAAVGAGVGAVLGAVGALLSKGEEAEVKPGTEFGMMVERAFAVDQEEIRVGPSAELLRSAQMVLRDIGYYAGPIDGRASAATRNALSQFQRDRGLSATGELDLRTAQELGLVSASGRETPLVSIVTARAAAGRDSVQINAEARTSSAGWNVFAVYFISRDTLHVYLRGEPPRGPAAQVIETHRINENYRQSNIARVIFHGAERDITVDLAAAPAGGTGDARQIAISARRLYLDYQRDLSVREIGGQLSFDPNRNYRSGEIELLAHLYSLAVAADFYNQVVSKLRDPASHQDAAEALIRQARFVERVIKQNKDLYLSRAVQSDLERLRAELSRITITDSSLTTDIDRIR